MDFGMTTAAAVSPAMMSGRNHSLRYKTREFRLRRDVCCSGTGDVGSSHSFTALFDLRAMTALNTQLSKGPRQGGVHCRDLFRRDLLVQPPRGSFACFLDGYFIDILHRDRHIR